MGWELLKSKIREQTISFAIFASKESKAEYNRLYTELQNLETKLSETTVLNKDELLHQYEIVKQEWDCYNSTMSRGSMIRSKCNWVENGEKCSRYFLNLEKYNYERKTITQLNAGTRSEPIVDKNEILTEI